MNKIRILLLGLAGFIVLFSCSVKHDGTPADMHSTGSAITKCANAQPQHFVLIHGAWHGSWAWFKIADLLKSKGHSVTLIDLPGHGIDQQNTGTVTLADCQNKIVTALDTINEPVILVGHSMGGIAISMAAEARPNKISKLIYLAAFLLSNSQSVMDIAGQDTNSEVLKNLIPNGQTGTMDLNRDNLQTMFYGNSDSQDVELARALIRPEALGLFVTPLTLTASNYGTVRKYYIETLQDKAITPPVQEIMMASARIEKAYKINTDHSPFFSKPNELLAIFQQIAAD